MDFQGISISEYTDNIKNIYNNLKSTKLVTDHDPSPDNIKEFSEVLNEISEYTSSQYVIAGSMVRFMYRKNPRGFISYLKHADLQHLSLLTDGFLIMEILQIKYIVFIKWNAAASRFIVTLQTRKKSRSSQRARTNSRGSRNKRNSLRLNDKNNKNTLNTPTKEPGTRVHHNVKFGRRSYLSAATSHRNTTSSDVSTRSSEQTQPSEQTQLEQPQQTHSNPTVNEGEKIIFTRNIDLNTDWADVED